MIDRESLVGSDGDVYKQDRLAARLRRTSGGVVFAYRGEYLDAGGPPVATTLPLDDEPVLTVGGAVPPYFAGLLPEGRRLTALAMEGRRDAFSRRSLLAFAGAVAIPARAAESALDQALAATKDVAADVAGGVVPFASDVRKKWAATLRRRHRDAQG